MHSVNVLSLLANPNISYPNSLIWVAKGREPGNERTANHTCRVCSLVDCCGEFYDGWERALRLGDFSCPDGSGIGNRRCEWDLDHFDIQWHIFFGVNSHKYHLHYIYTKFYNVTALQSEIEWGYRAASTIALGVLAGIGILGLFAFLMLRYIRYEQRMLPKALLFLALFILFVEPILIVSVSWGPASSYAFQAKTSLQPSAEVAIASALTSLDNGIYTATSFAESQVAILTVLLLVLSLELLPPKVGRTSYLPTIGAALSALVAGLLAIPAQGYIASLPEPGRIISVTVSITTIVTLANGTSIVYLPRTPTDWLNVFFGIYLVVRMYLPWLLWLGSLVASYLYLLFNREGAQKDPPSDSERQIERGSSQALSRFRA